jgi:hypothetical protein
MVIVATAAAGMRAQDRPRIERAAAESINRYSEWLGPPPLPASVITDQRRADTLRLPLWTSPSTMAAESATAYEVGRGWWMSDADANADPVIANGVSWYLQSRIVEQLYDYTYHNAGHHSDGASFFGGALGYGPVALRVGRVSALRHPAPVLPPSLDQPSQRLALALASLESTLGWPALQGALFEAMRRSRTAPLSLPEFGGVIADATGYDAPAVFAWYQQHQPVDLSIVEVSSAACRNESCVVTKITVSGGTAPLPQMIAVRVLFADGQQLDILWNGAGTRTFDLESASPFSIVQLDPDRAALLDRNWLDNQRRAEPGTNAPVRKWTARWMIWIQDAMLAYSATF